MNSKILLLIGLFACLVAVNARAEEPQIMTFDKEVVVHDPEGMAVDDQAHAPGTFMWISSEFGGPESDVKNAPYSAEAVTERTQELADGNRIVQKTSALMYRDSEGRTRREQQFGPIGSFASAETHKTILINDPVKDEHILLEPEDQTARKMPVFSKMRHHGPGPDGPAMEEDFVMPAPGPGNHQVFQFVAKPGDAKTESLGKQFVEGVEAEGTRTTMVIKAGTIGNERDIEIISEKWYSNELQLNVMTSHSDPRFGNTVYRLTNIRREEPDRSLFQIPAGYKVEEGSGGERVIIKKKIQN